MVAADSAKKFLLGHCGTVSPDLLDDTVREGYYLFAGHILLFACIFVLLLFHVAVHLSHEECRELGKALKRETYVLVVPRDTLIEVFLQDRIEYLALLA